MGWFKLLMLMTGAGAGGLALDRKLGRVRARRQENSLVQRSQLRAVLYSCPYPGIGRYCRAGPAEAMACQKSWRREGPECRCWAEEGSSAPPLAYPLPAWWDTEVVFKTPLESLPGGV